MVEKIIINPNKVRGYGNIMTTHTSTDYSLEDCTIATGTDTVNGATETVYTLTPTVGPSYIINDDASTDNSSTLFGSYITLRNSGTGSVSYNSNDPSYVLTNTTSSAEALIPYLPLEGITDSFQLTLESSVVSTSNDCYIGLYYYIDSNNWGGIKAHNNAQWLSKKTNGTFSEQSYNSGQSIQTKHIKTIIVFNASANTITATTYEMDDTQIQSKTLTIPITLTSSVKWGTAVAWNNNASHKVYYIKAEYI